MRFLIDTNIFIPFEITRSSDMEAGSGPAAEFIRICREHIITYLVHPAIKKEIQKDKDTERKKIRLHKLQSYPVLPDPPPLIDSINRTFGDIDPASHDYIDLLQLSALERHAVDYLVTDDRGIHKKAVRLDLSERVLTLSDALALINFQFPGHRHTLYPGVLHKKVHSLNPNDPIFQSLSDDYPGFDR